jgi:hypothetical protein
MISLGLGYQGIGLALECPSQPQQTGKDWEGEVNAAMAKIGPVSGGEVKTKAKAVTQDLLGKLPDAGKIYLEQMRYATICSSIRDDKSLSESEKRKQMREYDLETQKAIQQQAPKTKRPTSAPPLKHPVKEKESPVTPPVPQAKQPEAITCEQPLVGLTTKPKIFVPEWIPVLNTLREEKIVHDFQTLMQIRPRLRKYGGGPEEVRQANFTLDCLEKNDYLKTETLDAPDMIQGEFKNRTIMFLKPIPMLTILE